MGTWGTGIFSDDLAADLRGDFRDLIGEGVSPEEATARLVAENRPDEDPDDGPAFWLALAATQWRLGRLLGPVRDRALEIIAEGSGLKRWEREASPADVRKRRAVLEKLREELLTEPPSPKRVPKRFVRETQFVVGDVIGYRLGSGRIALLKVTGIHSDKGGRLPVVEVLDWKGVEPPSQKSAVAAQFLRPGTDAKGHFTTRFLLAQKSAKDDPSSRVQLVARGAAVETLPRPESLHYLGPDFGQRIVWWIELDDYLRDGFGID